MNEILAAMIVLVPIVTGLTEAVKRAIPKDVDRYAPAISIGLGIGAAFMFPPALSTSNEFAAGVLSGLGASGLYSAAKTAVQGK